MVLTSAEVANIDLKLGRNKRKGLLKLSFKK